MKNIEKTRDKDRCPGLVFSSERKRTFILTRIYSAFCHIFYSYATFKFKNIATYHRLFLYFIQIILLTLGVHVYKHPSFPTC